MPMTHPVAGRQTGGATPLKITDLQCHARWVGEGGGELMRERRVSAIPSLQALRKMQGQRCHIQHGVYTQLLVWLLRGVIRNICGMVYVVTRTGSRAPHRCYGWCFWRGASLRSAIDQSMVCHCDFACCQLGVVGWRGAGLHCAVSDV